MHTRLRAVVFRPEAPTSHWHHLAPAFLFDQQCYGPAAHCNLNVDDEEVSSTERGVSIGF
jgi:hypothetical protein